MNQDWQRATYEFRRLTQGRRGWLWAAIGLFGGLLLISSMFYSVAAHEQGVVLRFGEHVASKPPGLHMKLPWPIHEVVKVPIQQVRSLEFGYGTLEPGRVTRYRDTTKADELTARMLTGDLNLAHVEWIVQYRIHDAAKFLFKLGGGDSVDEALVVEDTIRDASESVMRKLVGDVSVDDVLTTGREQIAADSKRDLQAMLDRFDCGVTIVTVKLQTVSPPEQVKDAFDAVNRARQNMERVVNDALGERNKLIPTARGRRDREISEAEGYRERLVRSATGQASAFLSKLAEYRKAPEVTRTRLYLEAMQEVLAGVGEKLIIDESVRGILPLLDLNRQTPAAPPPIERPPGPSSDRPAGAKGGRP